jgi:hypothetical protein
MSCMATTIHTMIMKLSSCFVHEVVMSRCENLFLPLRSLSSPIISKQIETNIFLFKKGLTRAFAGDVVDWQRRPPPAHGPTCNCTASEPKLDTPDRRVRAQTLETAAMDSGGGGGSGAHKAASGSAPSPAQPAPNPTAMLSALMSKRAKLQEELRSIERQVRSCPPHAVSPDPQPERLGFVSAEADVVPMTRSLFWGPHGTCRLHKM